MRYLEEFRDLELSQKLAVGIRRRVGERELVLMEVCGTHTMAIHKFGIKGMLPESVKLLSGPGCPVCVTPNQYMDRAVALARRHDVIVTTFGDMMRVPGSSSSLEKVRAQGADVRMVYSCRDSLSLAREHQDKKIVFLGVGFETTSPTIAATLEEAEKQGVRNFYVLCGHKLIPPAMRALVENRDVKVQGFICPAHVSTIIGAEPYQFLADEYGIPCVIAGFEPLDILQGVAMLAKMIIEERPAVMNQYQRVAHLRGNPIAQQLLSRVFEICSSTWRGIGEIPASGYRIADALAHRDAGNMIDVEVERLREHEGCRCGEILQGLIIPSQCPLYAETCTPENPIGPCMVSSEGTCAAYYKYVGRESELAEG
jgi:hydrogenase expression/formation protein HypD